ncbi:MAG: hypothetical protein A3F95_00425 [Candidatus Nealsonbacteria bacterium RIFCSPLOWO2_12_FULL_39_31]|uniref:Uncharacterized protein n=2 Tax=Candidatus Nealsoniibacteriota TaxID=1817911 RepID=A0A1G2EJ90_9BACT|nr:MAG: hypothetical protein A2W71_00575 [Candidatus Nealsonbacteria bacterium RIFCSPLOWO2_02_39_8]OGZ25967.1 MAG: hypothetical protein A3F95_00425 [Candidatus Nealsonbacteria bacterium RIFCSPLOWO2_12_FULL_39_31]
MYKNAKGLYTEHRSYRGIIFLCKAKENKKKSVERFLHALIGLIFRHWFRSEKLFGEHFA